MNETYTVILPVSVMVSGKKTFAINLNIYRNAHHMALNHAKRAFSALVQEQVANLPEFTKVSLAYTIYPKTKQRIDLSNVCSIADKFFCDALVSLGKLPDDNYEYITNIAFSFGNVDPINPRITVQITPTT